MKCDQCQEENDFENMVSTGCIMCGKKRMCEMCKRNHNCIEGRAWFYCDLLQMERNQRRKSRGVKMWNGVCKLFREVREAIDWRIAMLYLRIAAVMKFFGLNHEALYFISLGDRIQHKYLTSEQVSELERLVKLEEENEKHS